MLPLLLLGLAGAASVAGSVISANQAKKADEEDRKASIEASKIPLESKGNLGALVADAEKHGFNPLSVLRAGGLSVYNTTTGHNAHLAARGLTSGISPLGEGLGALGGAISSFSQGMTSHARQAQEWKLMQAQIGNLNASTHATIAMSGAANRAIGGPASISSGPWDLAPPEPVVVPRMGGYNVLPDTGWSNAQEIEDRWGDLASWVYGAGVMVADGFNTLTGGTGKLHVPGISGPIGFITELSATTPGWKPQPQVIYDEPIGPPMPEYVTGGSFGGGSFVTGGSF